MTAATHATDHSNRPPRLEIFQATWAMMDLPGSPGPFDLQAAIKWTQAHGFAGLMCWAETVADLEAVKTIQDAGLLAGVGFPAHDYDQVRSLLQRCATMRATFVNAQVYDAFADDAEAVRKLIRHYVDADSFSVPLFVETHRGMVTQDLVRTVNYARQVRRVQFTLDASHYVLAGEIREPDNAPRFQELLAELVNRTACIHARVSNGEQIQVDIGDGSAEVARPYIRWWTSAYFQWLGRAAAGDIFPFVCELGPRPYAIARPSGEEMGDRLQQALAFKRIAERIRELGG